MQVVSAALFALVAFATSARYGVAQDFPTRPIRLITPFSAGGTADVVARIITERMSASLGQPIIIDTRPGAGGAIAMEIAANSNPDGYNIAFATSSTIIVVPLTRPGLTYPKRLAAVARIGNVPLVFVARNGLEANTATELVALARKHPGKISFGSSGLGGLAHMMGEGFRTAAGIDLLHVPYKGDAQAVAALFGSELDTAFVGIASVVSQVRGGTLKGLAIAGTSRLPDLPNVPTFSEAGYPGSSIDTSLGILAPVDTPRAIIERLSAAVVAAVNVSAVQDRMRQLYVVPAGAGPTPYADAIRRDTVHWTKVIEKLDLKDLKN